MRSIEELLEKRMEVYLEWPTYILGFGPTGNEIQELVMYKALVHSCINMQRRIDRASNSEAQIQGNDGELLAKFIITHWAKECD